MYLSRPKSPISLSSIDPRYYQIVYLSLFLIYGCTYLDWIINLRQYLVIFTTCISVQLFFVLCIKSISYHSVKSACISALGLCLLCKANSLSILCMASMLSISSKFLLRYKQKHLFNPVNFGMMVTIWLTKQAWVSPGQWGSNALLWLLMGITGFIVLIRVKRIDISLSFLVMYVLLHGYRDMWYLGWELDFLIHKLTNGTLILFAFFMITDPKTSPNHPLARVIWASSIALLSFVLDIHMQIYAAPLWALFFFSIGTPFLDYLIKANHFQWMNTVIKK